MRILKNVIEIELENKPCFVHRDNVAGIRCYKNYPNNNRGEYIVIIHLIHALSNQEFFTMGCEDAEPYIAWFNGNYTPGKTIVRDTCSCCREQTSSVSERPQFENKLLCDMCNDAQITLASIPEKHTITQPPKEQEYTFDGKFSSIFPSEAELKENKEQVTNAIKQVYYNSIKKQETWLDKIYSDEPVKNEPTALTPKEARKLFSNIFNEWLGKQPGEWLKKDTPGVTLTDEVYNTHLRKILKEREQQLKCDCCGIELELYHDKIRKDGVDNSFCRTCYSGIVYLRNTPEDKKPNIDKSIIEYMLKYNDKKDDEPKSEMNRLGIPVAKYKDEEPSQFHRAVEVYKKYLNSQPIEPEISYTKEQIEELTKVINSFNLEI